jgi:4-amino-4-deoxy-L-arabinose transferase-like glycosyltransferase
MKHKEFYLLVFSILFFYLAGSLNKYIKTTNYVDPFEDIDSKAYIYNAEKFYKNNNFTITGKDYIKPYFALGYPAFMSLVYKYLKPKNSSVIWVQILLAFLTSIFIFYTASIIFGSNIGIVAFILSTINVGFLTFSNFILTETLLAFLLSLFLYLFVLFLKHRKLNYVIFSGLVLGISIWVKPAAIYFVLPIILLIACLNKIFSLRAILLFAFSFYLPVLLYMGYNKVNLGNFSVTTLGNENLYLYFYPKVLAEKNNTDIKVESEKIRSMLTGSKLNPNSWIKIKESFKKDLTENYFNFASVWLKNVFKTLVGLYSTNLKVLLNKDLRGGDISFFKTKGKFLERIKTYIFAGTNLPGMTSTILKTASVYEAIWSILRYILAFLGLLFLLIKRDFKYFFFLFFYIFYFALITGHDGCARFRMMFEPALIILAAQGLFIIYYRLRYNSCPYGEL